MPGIASPAELEAAIEQFVQVLERGIRVEAAILYGSYVRGGVHDWSDINLAVISPDFEGMSGAQIQHQIADLTWGRYDSRIAAMGFPSSDYHSDRPSYFLADALRSARIVYQAPESAARRK